METRRIGFLCLAGTAEFCRKSSGASHHFYMLEKVTVYTCQHLSKLGTILMWSRGNTARVPNRSPFFWNPLFLFFLSFSWFWRSLIHTHFTEAKKVVLPITWHLQICRCKCRPSVDWLSSIQFWCRWVYTVQSQSYMAWHLQGHTLVFEALERREFHTKKFSHLPLQ